MLSLLLQVYTHSSVFLCCPVSRKQQSRSVRPRELRLCEQAPGSRYERRPAAPVSSRLCRASIAVHTLCTSPECFSQRVGNVSGKYCSSLNFLPCPAAPGCGSSREEAAEPAASPAAARAALPALHTLFPGLYRLLCVPQPFSVGGGGQVEVLIYFALKRHKPITPGVTDLRFLWHSQE